LFMTASELANGSDRGMKLKSRKAESGTRKGNRDRQTR
jgi:hypothetical protein